MSIFRAMLDKFPDALLAVLLALAFALAVHPEIAVAQEESEFIQSPRARVGVGRRRGESEYFQSLRAQAEQGDADAQLKLGAEYYNGDVVSRDFSKAVKWYHHAAMQGNVNAQRLLGLCYECGDGVQKNRKCAYVWFSLAAKGGDEEAAERLETLKQLPPADLWLPIADEKIGRLHDEIQRGRKSATRKKKG